MRWWRCSSRPLGLPIPHTAIIQGNQHRIADKLGEFIEVHFLEAAPVEAKLRQIDFGSFIADWLRDRKRSTDLARFTLRLLPEAMTATETSGLMSFITPPHHDAVAGDRSRAARRRHAARLRRPRAGIRVCSTISCARCIDTLTQADTMAVIREKDPRRAAVAAEPLSRRRVPGEAGSSRPRRRSSTRCATIRNIRSAASSTACCCRSATGSARDPAYAEPHRRLEARSAGAPRTRRARANICGRTRRIFIERSASGESMVLQKHLAGMFVEAGGALAADDEIARRDQRGHRRRAAELHRRPEERRLRASSPIRSRPGTWRSSSR